MIVLAEQGKWDEILFRLNRNTNSSTHLGSMYITNPEDAASPLHAILRHRPTPAVVDSLIRKLQHDSSTLESDALIPEETREKTLQQTPLHVAVASGCSIPVLERLLQGDSLVIPAMSKDGLHRFPLHWACAPTTTRNLRFPWQRQADTDYRYNAIHFLLEQYPVAVVIPDLYRQTPLDYARQHKLPRSVVELLEGVATEFEKYAPKYRADDSPVDGTPSESESFQNALPDGVVMIGSAEKADTPGYGWEEDDDVSSLGGDFSYMCVEPFDNATKTKRMDAIVHVKSLFSSALSFGVMKSLKIAMDHATNASVDTSTLVPAGATSRTTEIHFFSNDTATEKVPASFTSESSDTFCTGVMFYPAHHVKVGTVSTRTAKTASNRAVAIRETPSLSRTEEEEDDESYRRRDDTTTIYKGTVRTKTLLKGNIQIKKGPFRKMSRLAASPEDVSTDSFTEDEEEEE